MNQQDTMKMLIVHSNINKNHNKKYHKIAVLTGHVYILQLDMNTVYLRTGCNLVLKKYILCKHT